MAPFELSSGASCHGYSEPLQRILTDFGADQSFAKAAAKAKEHYGITLPISGVRTNTLIHADNMCKAKQAKLNNMKDFYGIRHRKHLRSGTKSIITETDGCMIPIVHASANAKDKRKKKSLMYKEGRLSLSYAEGSVTPTYEAIIGDVNMVGKGMRLTAEKCGLGFDSHIHAVGDGARWIAKQFEEKFSDIEKRPEYLIDFFHLSEYISAASVIITSDIQKQKLWFKRQTKLLKNGQVQLVLKNLEKHSNASIDDPVSKCYNYIANRPGQFKYKEAIEQKLPIGSGRVEGGHRHVIQERLKISGAWWLEITANSMLALRANRANNQWEEYWKSYETKT